MNENSVSATEILSPPQAGGLNAVFERCGDRFGDHVAGWHGAHEIPSLDGLAGAFDWLEDLRQQSIIAFEFTPGEVGSAGTYQLERAGVAERGEFNCVPNNPAVGWATLVLRTRAGAARPFVFSRVMSNSEGLIDIALLNSIDSRGPVQPPFMALRR